jgi:hypothetical protein
MPRWPPSPSTARVLDWSAPDPRPAPEAGAACGCARASGLCRDLPGRWGRLWASRESGGAGPTDGAAERALRPAVPRRERSRGTRPEVGSRYVASMPSVAATRERQGRRVRGRLADLFTAAAEGRPAPSLLPSPSTDTFSPHALQRLLHAPV